jgi:hypothetical protein
MNTTTNIMGNYDLAGDDRPNTWLMEGRLHNPETFWLETKCATEEDEVTITLFFERLTPAEVDAFTESMGSSMLALMEWNVARKIAETEDAES